MRPHRSLLAALTLATACTPLAGAQGLGGRIAARRDGAVAIQYAVRADVCGFGGTVLRVGTSTFAGETTVISSSGDWAGAAGCERGPVRVLVTRAEGRTVGIRAAIGGSTVPEGTTDLGTVSAREASEWFLAQAAELDGRLGRDALLPAVIADSTEVWRGLLALVGNRALSRGLRESATGWLGREAVANTAAAREITTQLARLAGDREEPASLRSRAVSSLARLEVQATPLLVSLAEADDPVVSRAAFQALGRSSDPRAREALRRNVREGRLPDAARAEAIRSLGGRDAVPADYALLRQIWPTLSASSQREAVVNALGEAGGAENMRWLLDQAGGASVPSNERARAVRGAVRAGARSEDLIRLYDSGPDRRVKEALLESLAQIGDRAAIDKLIAVARTETDAPVRRAAVNRLARLNDERAEAALREMVEKP